jgi:hypothetical protein
VSHRRSHDEPIVDHKCHSPTNVNGVDFESLARPSGTDESRALELRESRTATHHHIADVALQDDQFIRAPDGIYDNRLKSAARLKAAAVSRGLF